MGKSGRVRLSDLNRAHRLIHDARDVGRDPAAWPTLLADGIARLLDAQLIVLGAIRLDPVVGLQMEAILADRGWACEADRSRWAAGYIEDGEFRQSSGFQRLSESFGGLFVRSREQFSPDDEWYASAEFNEYHRKSGLDDFLAAVVPMGPTSVFGVTCSRALHARRFESRERRLARIFFRELGRHFGVNLLLRPGEDVETLPRRLRQTLECLLDGDSEKQVALRLGLSRHTIHDYVKALYRHFGVSSRGELMARHVRDRRDGGRSPQDGRGPQ